MDNKTKELVSSSSFEQKDFEIREKDFRRESFKRGVESRKKTEKQRQSSQ